MNKAYSRIYWQNTPSVASPINETNLNRMDEALNTVDDRVVAFDTSKADATDLLNTIVGVAYDTETGTFTFTKKDTTTFTVDTDLEKIAVNFDYDDDPLSAHYQEMIITLADGTKKYIDLSAFITVMSFVDSSTIDFTVTGSNVTAGIKAGSITGSMLQPNYLADITVQAQNAASSASDASDSATAASNSATDAAASAQTARQAISEGYYVSFTINSDGELIYSKTIGTESQPTLTNLGMVTAYGEAKSKGYVGTETEFGTVLANAATYATTAQTAASTATQAASDTVGYCTRAEAAATSAESDAASALASKNAASLSETNAATSETNAATSETNAATSETNALASQTAAAASATSAAADAVSTAADASTCTTAATSASADAESALASKNAAYTSEQNAYYWEEQARDIAHGLSGAIIPMGTRTFEELPTTNINVGWMYNISNGFTTDSRFEEGAGIPVGAGAEVYFTGNEKWSIMVGSAVAGVKGDSESSYRTGNVNITKGNIGLGNVDNTSDLDKPVSTAAGTRFTGIETAIGNNSITYDALTKALTITFGTIS